MNVQTVYSVLIEETRRMFAQVNTFADLTRLRWLDLSDNRLNVIQHRAFYGLTLQHLFLNGNRDIRLLPGSFDGLVTSGLYLHDCALQVLLPEILSPLNGTLVNLWLNGNRLKKVDRRLAPVFSQLSHLRLGANPLHCGCEALWLKQLYDRQGGATFRGAEPPTCWTPTRLQTRHFDQLTSADLHCTAPSFGNIDAVLDWRGTGRLRCTATGQPTPVIYWIRPSGRTQRFDVRAWQVNQKRDSVAVERPGDELNEAKLSINYDDAQSGLFICVAKNEVGNVTLTVNVTWPAKSAIHKTGPTSQRAPLSERNRLKMLRPAQSPTLSVINVDRDDQLLQVELSDAGGYERGEAVVQVTDGVRLFTVSQLVAAVVGTHLCTVLLFVVVLLPVHLVRAKRRRRSETVDSLRVRDSLLSKPAALMSASRTATVRSHRWPAPVVYDFT